MRRARREAPSSSSSSILLVIVLLAAAGGAAYFAPGERALAPDSTAPRPPSPASAVPAPAAPPIASRPPSPEAPPPTQEPRQAEPTRDHFPSDEDLERSAEKLAKERMRAQVPPAALEAGGDSYAHDLYDALKTQAREELKLGMRATIWGKQHGKPPESQRRVFLRIVDAAHRANDTGGFTEDVIAALYADEDRLDRAAK